MRFSELLEKSMPELIRDLQGLHPDPQHLQG